MRTATVIRASDKGSAGDGAVTEAYTVAVILLLVLVLEGGGGSGKGCGGLVTSQTSCWLAGWLVGELVWS